jgi:hypothetical protein
MSASSSTQAASTVKSQLCSFLQGLPKSYNTARVGDVLQYIADLTAWDGAGLSLWEASKIYESLTAEKVIKTPKELGAIVRGALALLVSAPPAPETVPYEASPDVFKAAVAMEGKPGGDADAVVPFPWLKTTIPLPERFQAVLTAVDDLADAGLRRRLVRSLPEYTGIDPVPTNNAPSVPQGDGEKAGWDRQVRVLQRLIATLYLVIGEDKVLDTMEAEFNADDLFELVFAFLTTLSKDIGGSRKGAVDRRFKPAESNPLLTKEDLKNITAANAVSKELRGGSSRPAPYPSPYRSNGNFRGRGKGGKGRGRASGKGKGQHRQRYTFGDNKPTEVTN